MDDNGGRGWNCIGVSQFSLETHVLAAHGQCEIPESGDSCSSLPLQNSEVSALQCSAQWDQPQVKTGCVQQEARLHIEELWSALLSGEKENFTTCQVHDSSAKKLTEKTTSKGTFYLNKTILQILLRVSPQYQKSALTISLIDVSTIKFNCHVRAKTFLYITIINKYILCILNGFTI